MWLGLLFLEFDEELTTPGAMVSDGSWVDMSASVKAR
jgi:hypothetical protein